MNLRTEDELVSQISHWLARHIGDAELLARIAALRKQGLSLEQGQAVDELVAELSQPDRSPGQLEMVARETLEALALGG
jgi:hypothetical protein